METTKENFKTDAAEDNRYFVNIAVTKEQKSAITKHAIVNCGISVSEYGRTKMLDFNSQKKVIETVINDANGKDVEEFLDEANKIITDQSEKLAAKDERISELEAIVSSGDYQAKKDEANQVPESALFLDLTPDQRKIVELALVLESKSFFGDSYADLNHFIKKKIGDLITSNQNSFPAEYFEKGAPEFQTAFDFINFLKEVPENGK